MAPFVARKSFPKLTDLPRAYYLGHHKAGLDAMKAMLNEIDLVIECRDSRVPLTSRNPMFEESLAGLERLIVYTKRDLVRNIWGGRADKQREQLLRQWQKPTSILFSDHKDRQSVQQVLAFVREHIKRQGSLLDARMLVVGMPNVGKSSMLNALRSLGVGKGKVAFTGAQPGVTRKISTAVKIIEGEGGRSGAYISDTPGVFMPYVPDDQAMLKLALCGSVKDSIIPAVILVDYLLYHINKHDPEVYAKYHEPTNNVLDLVAAVARKTGRLQRGGIPDEGATALWIIQRWRTGHFGHFMLDEVTEESLELDSQSKGADGISFNQAIKADKEFRRQRSRLAYAASR